jgi:hypothetical protein
MKRIKSLIQQLGYVSAASYLTGKLLDKLFGIYMHHVKFYSQPISSAPRIPESKLNRYEFTWLNQPEKILDELERPRAVLEARFNQGSACLIAKQNNSFQGCLWLVKSKYIEDQFRAIYHFPDNAVWDYDVYITPKKRFSMLFAALWDTADSWMKEHGIISSLSRISAYNAQSIRSHETAGAKQIGWMIVLEKNDWQIAISDKSPWLHFSLNSGNNGPKLHFTKI